MKEVAIDGWGDAVCEHGTALDVHCCNCHSGFLFDADSCVCVFTERGNEMREVRINAVMNGYVVTVGCQSLVFQTGEELLRELGEYLRDPQSTEKRYLERFRDRMPLPAAEPAAEQAVDLNRISEDSPRARRERLEAARLDAEVSRMTQATGQRRAP